MNFEIRAIVPVKWSAKEILDEIQLSVDSVAMAVKKDFEATVATWNEQPRFESTVGVGSGALTSISIAVGTNSPRWAMLNEGTKPRMIDPGPGRVLAFQTGYRAKTRPRQFRSYKGGAYGPRIVRPRAFLRRGIEPRAWTDEARKKYQPILQQALIRATTLGALKAMGYGVSKVVSGR